MRFDYKSEPFFESIETGVLDLWMYDENDLMGYSHCHNWLEQIWSHAAPQIRKNVCFPCSTYLKAVYKSMPAFNKLMRQSMFGDEEIEDHDFEDTMTPPPMTEQDIKAEDAYKKLLGESYGCYLLAQGSLLFIYGIHTDCAFDESYSFCMYVFKGRMMACYVQKGEDYSYMCSNAPSAVKVFYDIYGKDGTMNAKDIVAHISHERDMIILFEKYAKVENRIVAPKARFRYNLKSLTMDENGTRLKIQIRDSLYFTNVMRNEGFDVSAHLRLQPCKNPETGEWTHKLIVISQYHKNGYHRQAKIAKVC